MGTITVVRKRAGKEKSLQALAREQARGTRAKAEAARPAEKGPDERLKEQLARLVQEHASELDEEDRLFAERTGHMHGGFLPGEKSRAVLLLARFGGQANGRGSGKRGGGKSDNGKPAVASEDVPPAMTAATKPAGIAKRNGHAKHQLSGDNSAWSDFREALRANRPVPEDLAEAAQTGAEVEIALDRIQPHPANRHASEKDPDVIDLAQSIEVDRLLQAITVRPTCKAERELSRPFRGQGAKDFEIIVGERRWLACRVAGLPTVRCKIRTDVDDAQALRYIAIENAKRKDLDPIERARLIERLCRPLAEGGAGLTLEAAAKDVGFQDGASASSCRRLLALTKVWQDRVAAGELPESFARLILPYIESAALMEVIDADWKRAHGAKATKQQREEWESRAGLAEHLDYLVHHNTRPIDKGEVHHYDNSQCPGPKTEPWRYAGWYQRLFALTPDVTRDLAVLVVGGIQRTTNVKLYDKLQVPLIKQQVDERKKSIADQAGRGADRKAAAKGLSPAEQKKRDADRARQLRERIDAWRHKLLRQACAQAIEAGLDSGLRIVLAFAADSHAPYGAVSFGQALHEVRKIAPRKSGYRHEYWPCVAAVEPMDVGRAVANGDHEGEVVAGLARRILGDEGNDWRRPTLPHSLVDSYAAAIGVKLPQAWANLKGNPAMLEEFFLLHGTEPLRQLGEELGVFLGHASNRGAMVKLLLAKVSGSTLGMALRLPKSIRPLAGDKKRKAAGKAKRKGSR